MIAPQQVLTNIVRQSEIGLSAFESVSTDLSYPPTDIRIMLNFSSHLQWFQAKIGSYDKQIWETSVEQRILQGLENRPKKEGSLHKELIDIDLVRGSTFSKAKPRHGLKSVIFNGLKRVIFFPYYYSQWRDHLNKELVYCFMFHYVIQLIQLILYFLWSNSSEIMLEEILLPVVLALSLGVLHAHIIAPYTVKQRRKKTFSTSSNKVKNWSGGENNIATPSPISKQHSVQHTVTTQLSSSSQEKSKDLLRLDSVNICQDNLLAKRANKKNVLFTKSISHNSDISDEEGPSCLGTKNEQQEEYDGETETKDSSSSEKEDVVFKNNEVDPNSATKYNEQNDPGGIDSLSTVGSLKTLSKKVKISDSSGYGKIKIATRKCSQSEGVIVADEEGLKKFISAKNKHIPDPTPINNCKKDKEKVHRKQSNSGSSQKPSTYKSGKTRRLTTDWTSNNSGVSSGNVSGSNMLCNRVSISSTMDPSKIEPEARVTGSTIIQALEGMEFNDLLNGNASSHGTITDHSSDDKQCTNDTIENIDSKTSLIATDIPATVVQKSVHNQPHTLGNNTGNRSRHRIEVRKISSADASPTPSRKSSVPFSSTASLNRDIELNQSTPLQLIDPHDQSSLPCLLEQPLPKVIDTSISSEDYSSKIVDLNEDTITKCHKKREELRQLFELKAYQGEKVPDKSVSSTSSSRNSVTDMKHCKMKARRGRDLDYKSVAADSKKKKHRREIVQSMSETEYDRMNSDVNSTGNSTSDAEDMCQELGAEKLQADDDNDDQVSELKVDNSEEHVEVIGGMNCNIMIGKNDNNVVPEEVNRPLQSGDIFQPEMDADDPFVMWYKEAHTPGMTGSVSCYIWENDELKKTNLSLLDIGWSIIQAVERHVQEQNYSIFGFFTVIILCFTPLFFRAYINRTYLAAVVDMSRHSDFFGVFFLRNSTLLQSIVTAVTSNTSMSVIKTELSNVSSTNDHVYSWTNEIMPLAITSVLASEWPMRLIIVFGVILRMILYTMTFLMLCVAENSFEQRLQYAKHFCRLTSSRRARKYYLPHFRLNKLANIKCWLSLRSYLKKRGPQRSVESIISSAFYMLLAMLSLVCVNLLQSADNLFINRLINWDLMLCSVALGVFMMRFLVLGTKITKKYRNLSVIITEQINLFLAMQTRPHKKEELTLAHNVLRLAESLLKEVEGPFRICGWSMNPFLYNILKVVILSVFSTVLSETCGFKMKLYKIKINPANW